LLVDDPILGEDIPPGKPLDLAFEDSVALKVAPFEQARIAHGSSLVMWDRYGLIRCIRSQAILAAEPPPKSTAVS
jgi:hypothetical protein